jgi:hypothetical protein
MKEKQDEKINNLNHNVKENKVQDVIDTIYTEEFNESFSMILHLTEKDFFAMLNQKATYILAEYYSNLSLSNPVIKEEIIRSEEALRKNIYKPTLLALRDINNQDGVFIKDFVKHCSNTECYALHTCKDRLVKVKLIGKIVYYCHDCKVPYQSDLLHLFCSYCNMTYYSNISDEIELQPATWLNYHCGAIVNEKMRCIKCNSTFYLDSKKNMLFCIKCDFEIDPLKIFWKCIICEDEFKSLAKFYSANEFKMLKSTIKNALITKIKAKPPKVPCCSIDRPEDYIFTHKTDCSGLLYKTTNINNKTMVVCEKCKTMNQYDKFIWTCPKCEKRFRLKSRNGENERTPSNEKIPLNTQENDCKPFKSEEPIIRRQSGNLIRIVSKDRITPVKINIVRDISKERQKIPISNRGSESKLVEDLRRSPVKDKKSPVRRIIYKSENKYFAPIGHAISPNIKVAIKKLNEYNDFNTSNFLEDENKKLSNESKGSRMTNDSETTENISLLSFNKSDYKVLCKIGEGSYGIIYSVIDKNGKTFAMKKIIAHSIKELLQFTKEFELVHSCQHKSIVKLLGMCSTTLDSTTHALYILMEQADSDWEKEIVTRGHAKSYYKEEELIDILKVLTAPLAFLQKSKISHRDIKPQNVLIYPNNDFKLADFGEAKKLTNDVNTLRGTEIYMSPILFHGLRTKSVDVIHNTYKSDVFSLGLCILFAATLNFRCLVDIREITNMKVLSNIINRYLRDRYSNKFHSLLRKMIELEEKLRVDFIELEKLLDDY